MSGEPKWCELYRYEDGSRARTLATTIAAMEFDVRIVDARTRQAITPDEHLPDPPYLVEVDESDWFDLKEVLAELVQEQDDFDWLLANRDSRAIRVQQVFLLSLILILAVLALSGVIEL